MTDTNNLRKRDTALNKISQTLNNVANQIAGIYNNETMKDDIKTIKAQLIDLNLELHDFNKWRRAVEEKIGVIEC
jgi:hypothetical protein